jgi:hypothetical protein
MKKKLVITTSLLLAVSGFAVASPSDSFFEDDFFSSSPFNGDFWDDEEDEEDDSSFGDSWFDDPFFSDNDDEEDRNETEEGCDEDEVHIPEDRDCDGEIDDEFQGDYPENDTRENETDSGNETDENESESQVTEEAYLQEVPEEGDYYYEAGTDDWVSYVNPRDEYNPEYESRDEAPGSGKVCFAVMNEEGDPIVGETLPNTQASMDLGGIEWHSHANPFTVEFPLTENYERPLDSDQFGTSDNLPQGDGILDTHCLEFHQVEENHTLTYDEVEITGEHAEDLEVVGYYDQLNTWSTDFDPENDVSPYGTDESSDGVVSMSPGNTHAEVLAVLQLDRS